MIEQIYYSPVHSGISKQLNLSDFSFKNSDIKCLKRILNKNSELKENKLVKFIERTYYYVKIAINKYSNAFSNHLYSQHALFTILAMKIYTKSTYRDIMVLSKMLLIFCFFGSICILRFLNVFQALNLFCIYF